MPFIVSASLGICYIILIISSFLFLVGTFPKIIWSTDNMGFLNISVVVFFRWIKKLNELAISSHLNINILKERMCNILI